MATGDVDQNAACAVQTDFIEQWIGNCFFSRLNSAVFALRFACAHHRLAHFIHYGADIGKVQIDQAGAHHQIGDAFDALIQDVIRHAERICKGGFFIRQTE